MKVRRVDFYADDFLVGVQGMSDAACGIYWKACSLIYSHGGPIPLSELRRWCSSRGPFMDILNGLISEGKLTLSDGLIASKRALNELERASNRNQKWIENGSKGGRPPIENNEIAKPSDITNGETAPLTSIIHHPSINKKNISSDLRSDVTDEGFKKFYEVYPRHEARRAAERAWKAALKRASPETIIDGAKRYAEQRLGQDKQYTKLPASWLNADCWTDESGSINGHAPTGPTGPRPSLKELLGDDYERAMALAH